jgi:hypothetical protein
LEAADEELRRDCSIGVGSAITLFQVSSIAGAGHRNAPFISWRRVGERLDLVNDAEDRLRRSEHSASNHL